MRRLLITGGAGFIGSNFVKYMLKKYSDYKMTVIDRLDYAGNLENLKEVENNKNYKFIKGDICNEQIVNKLVKDNDITINFAAATHVDRSIIGASEFVRTNVQGTYILLESARKEKIEKYIQISTDECYGSVEEGSFKESSPLKPSNPYAASKAGGDMLVYAYFITYKLPVNIIRSVNNFGPYQYPEKFIPLFITNALEDRNLPLYGDGKNIRDWLYVYDNCAATDIILHKGKEGEIYNVGRGEENCNLTVAHLILETLSKSAELICFVEDRKGHDRRYALDSSKVKALGWQPRHRFEEAIEETVKWYVKNKGWWQKIKEKREYKDFYQKWYKIEEKH